MTSRDPAACRRALREIGEIAAVAVLPDSRMTEQEALQTIAAIAEWVETETPKESAGCGDVIRRLNDLIAWADLDGLEDRDVLNLFNDVIGALQCSGVGEPGWEVSGPDRLDAAPAPL